MKTHPYFGCILYHPLLVQNNQRSSLNSERDETILMPPLSESLQALVEPIGGTEVTVTGENFAAYKSPNMNLSQTEISVNTSNGFEIFDVVNYVLTPCSVHNDSEMNCKTPKQSHPAMNELRSFKARYRFGFIFQSFEEEQDHGQGFRRNTSTAISVEMAIVKLPQIPVQHWSAYDVTEKEPLHLQAGATISNGYLLFFQIERGGEGRAFQHEVEVRVVSKATSPDTVLSYP
ncbi:hypothetical protein CAPTEDRAFT_200580 [Capitella teleta]|uniref:IPT/TIG domain-containing protein n=1 Tax=Capitella teleta TaxID=283909 RepID=R7T8Y5_CAPTE|nr:hypothetical protein CAPTEDRAFT_200580 [Capitella teleta]|eukprot:ELT89888.1 hypothetical protein CAPTEDRAFT_200580 [Capitella teleta]